MDADYKDKSRCEICDKEFSLTRSRHKCKRCGLIICSDCNKGTAVIIGFGDKAAHKVCKYCEEESSAQKAFKNENGASWGKLSKKGDKWLNLNHIKAYMALYDEDYNYYLQQSSISEECIRWCNEIDNDMKIGKYDKEYFNFSMIEFLHYSQEGKTIDVIRNSVSNVLKAFVAKNPQIGYRPGLAYMTIFLLCILDQRNAFWMLNYIVDKILPADFYSNNPILLYGCMRENYVISQHVLNYLKDLKEEQNQQKIQILIRFFNETGPVLLQNFLIDSISFDSTLYIWTKIIEENSYKEFEKYFLCICNKSDIHKLIFEAKEANLAKFSHTVCKFVSRKYLEHFTKEEITEEIKLKLETDFIENIVPQLKDRMITHVRILQVLSGKSISNDGASDGANGNSSGVVEPRVIKEEMEKYVLERRGTSGSNKGKASLKEPYYFTKGEFIHVWEAVQKRLGDVVLEKEIWDKVFDILDSDKVDKVSNKKLGTLLTLLDSNIDMPLKLSTIFSMFENSSKDILNKNEANDFCEVLLSTLLLLGPLDYNSYFYKDITMFKYEIAKKTRKADKIKLSELDLNQMINTTKRQYGLLLLGNASTGAGDVGDIGSSSQKLGIEGNTIVLENGDIEPNQQQESVIVDEVNGIKDQGNEEVIMTTTQEVIYENPSVIMLPDSLMKMNNEIDSVDSSSSLRYINISLQSNMSIKPNDRDVISKPITKLTPIIYQNYSNSSPTDNLNTTGNSIETIHRQMLSSNHSTKPIQTTTTIQSSTQVPHSSKTASSHLTTTIDPSKTIAKPSSNPPTVVLGSHNQVSHESIPPPIYTETTTITTITAANITTTTTPELGSSTTTTTTTITETETGTAMTKSQIQAKEIDEFIYPISLKITAEQNEDPVEQQRKMGLQKQTVEHGNQCKVCSIF